MRNFLAFLAVVAAVVPAADVQALPPARDAAAPLRTLVMPTGPIPAARVPGPVTMLPKWRVVPDVVVTPHADQYGEYRAAHPEIYAVTVPPAGNTFRSVAEWESMSTMLLANPGGLPATVRKSITDMIVGSIDVIEFDVLVPSDAVSQEMETALVTAGVSQTAIDARVRFLTYAADSVWMADYGPLPLLDGDRLALVDFRYYLDRVTDDAVPTQLGNYWDVTTYRAPLDYEGGNFATDGEGTCYASQGLYWYNADKTVARIDELMAEYLGCRKIIVLAPLEDGTTHIDMFSKLASKNVMVLGTATTADATSTTIATLEQDAQILDAAVLADGSGLTVYRIPMPFQRDDVWRTYTNATFANGVNLVPTYAARATHQAEAMAVWAEAMPDWTHIAVESGEIITWGGAMHCISRTIPTAQRVPWVADGTCTDGTCGGVDGGYAGACEDDADCIGPALECDLNECESTTDCGAVTYEGCCDGDRVRYCEDDQIQVLVCQDGCGWSAEGYYDCGGKGEDPSGSNPRVCDGGCEPDCESRDCGDDGCGGSCGTCNGGTCSALGVCESIVADPGPDATNTDVTDPGPDVPATDPGTTVPDASPGDACVPECSGGRCGDDGCGGRCPDCAEGYVCGEASFCIRYVETRDVIGSDASTGDLAPVPLNKGTGGCAAVTRPGSAHGEFPGALPWLLAPILFLVVYNTRRV